MIRHLGLAEVFECSQCDERFVGSPNDEKTKTWKTAHEKNHTKFKYDPDTYSRGHSI